MKVDGHPGQFVTALTLSKDVGIALKDHGGAASGYQNSITYLKAIEAILLSRYTSKGDGRSHGQARHPGVSAIPWKEYHWVWGERRVI